MASARQVDASAELLELLERQLRRVEAELAAGRRRDGALAAPLVELARVRDDLASYLLAARVLVESGVSEEALLPLLSRASRRRPIGQLGDRERARLASNR